MNTVSSNTKYVVKVQNFNVIGASLKSANESNDKANIKAGGGDDADVCFKSDRKCS